MLLLLTENAVFNKKTAGPLVAVTKLRDREKPTNAQVGKLERLLEEMERLGAVLEEEWSEVPWEDF